MFYSDSKLTNLIEDLLIEIKSVETIELVFEPGLPKRFEMRIFSEISRKINLAFSHPDCLKFFLDLPAEVKKGGSLRINAEIDIL